jgi:predicted RecB family nuclease
MRVNNNKLIFSASDLSRHLGCRHVTELDWVAANGGPKPPKFVDARMEALQERGYEHEEAYIKHLEGQDLSVVRLDDRFENANATEETLQALQSGADVVVQATVSQNAWFGRTDVLRRVERPSKLGAWSYEVLDTKLARETKGATILQLCLYSDLLGNIQGTPPDQMHVVSPWVDFEPESFRVGDYMAYYRFVRHRLESSVGDISDGSFTEVYPEPVEQCDLCRWRVNCRDRRREDDHLCLVAGISKIQTGELQAKEVETLSALAKQPLPISNPKMRGSTESYTRVREQARVQVEAREKGQPVFEFLPREPGRGLSRLPKPSVGDVFFDIESARFVGEHGLEYLFGYVLDDPAGAEKFEKIVALNWEDERSMIETFIDFVMERWSAFPDMHIYHYAPYEPSALKRLVGRYGTREEELDQILRPGVLVDLYAVVRQGIRAGIERYSIKDLEIFYQFERMAPLQDATSNLIALERALEMNQPETIDNDVLDVVVAYNRDDCVSTRRLRDWLETLREQLTEAGEEIERPEQPEAEPSQEIDETQQRVNALRKRLLENFPSDLSEWTPEQQAKWLIAHLLDWHRREAKTAWWEYFRLSELSAEDLLGERAAVAGLEFVGDVEGPGRTPIHRYSFPPQETKIRSGDKLHLEGGDPAGSAASIDLGSRLLDLKKRGDSADVHPAAVFEHDVVNSRVLSDSLLRFGDWVADNGMDESGPYKAIRDLLKRATPRLLTKDFRTLSKSADTVAAARQASRELDESYLTIQGPPGAGKTFAGARIICELVAAGKKVGVTGTSHKVIRNLLDEVVKASTEENLTVNCIQKVREPSEEPTTIEEVFDNSDVLTALQEGEAHVAGGTAWLWARPEFAEEVDVLIIDEAGQMSLANVAAVSQGATNLVLLGDPQQLEQPQQGTHPDGVGVSALDHLLEGAQTISSDRGFFLAETWRLPPSISEFTSEIFYDGRLTSHPGQEVQVLTGKTEFAGSGLKFIPLPHEGNQTSSPEEVDEIAKIVNSLVGGDVSWVDRDGISSVLTLDDILIVAPYNAQVSLILDRMPEAKVGTVDRFQGQEAPVVLVSLATSSPEEAPRGREFLYSPNRLNVATSRAQCVSILIANPRLFEPECHTPRQIQLANAFCRYVEFSWIKSRKFQARHD